jgi:hypothetical protein
MIKFEFGDRQAKALEKIQKLDETADVVQVLRDLGVDVTRVFEGTPLIGFDMRNWSIDETMSFRGAVIKNCQMTGAQRQQIEVTHPKELDVQVRPNRNGQDDKAWPGVGPTRAKMTSAIEAFSEAERRVVQAKAQEAEVLNFEDLVSLERLPNFDGLPTVKELSLRNTNVSDINNVAKLRNLQRLNLEGAPLTEIGALSGLRHLGRIHLKRCKNFSLKPLLSIRSSLIGLNVSRTSLTDYYAIEGLTALKWLNISHIPKSFRIKLERLTSLEKLFAACTKLDGHDIRACTKLKHLNVDGCGEFLYLRYLSSLKALETLSANGAALREFPHDHYFPELQCVFVNDTPISEIPLGSKSALTELSVEGCPVSDVSRLEHYRKLTSLNISRTNVKSIKPLRNLPNLRHLEVKGLLSLEGLDELKMARKDIHLVE